jgi:hypothetical protein
VIERVFGVLKKRFRILLLPPEYDLEIQAQIPAVLCALHNFVLTHDSIDVMNDEENEADTNNNKPVVNPSEWRDRIAEAMWNDYQAILADHELENLDGWSDFDESDIDFDIESDAELYL